MESFSSLQSMSWATRFTTIIFAQVFPRFDWTLLRRSISMEACGHKYYSHLVGGNDEQDQTDCGSIANRKVHEQVFFGEDNKSKCTWPDYLSKSRLPFPRNSIFCLLPNVTYTQWRWRHVRADYWFSRPLQVVSRAVSACSLKILRIKRNEDGRFHFTMST